MSNVIVIGGGVSGLATAHELLRADPSADVVVLEATDRLGGNVRTLRRDGAIIDLGPDAVLNSRKEAIALCGSLGLGDALIQPEEASRSVLIATDGKLQPLPEGLVFGVPSKLGQLISTPLLSWRGKLRAALDLLLPATEPGSTSVGELIGRRLGTEVKERLVEPLVGAVYAADIDRLDAAVGLPFAAAAKGSLVRAMARAPRGTGSPFRAPANGMSELVDALVRAVGTERIRTGSGVASVRAVDGAWQVALRDGTTLTAPQLVLAVPPHEAAAMVAETDGTLGDALREIGATTTATVILAFPPGTELPQASGVLIPRSEGRPTIAATFVHRKWGRPNPTGAVVIRAFLGGGRNPALIDASDDAELVRLALVDLRAFMELPEPLWTTVARWVRATPHPAPGHHARMQSVRALLAERPGLHVVGAAYEGPGIAGCAAQAARTAAKIAPAKS